MDKINQFFKVVYSDPRLIWLFFASLLFTILSFIIFAVPSFGFPSAISRQLFAGLMLLYGLYRFYTFYVAYKKEKDE